MKVILIVWLVMSALLGFEPQSTGILLLHGKGGTVAKTWSGFKNGLENSGFIVLAKDMPWSKDRYIDKTYEASLEEVKSDIETLKAKGVQRVVVIGHSMGANVALAYASLYPIDALVLLAPGHNPDRMTAYFQPSVSLAKKMMDEHKGDETASFSDLNGGKQFMREMHANVYYSFFAPDGLAAMEVRAKKLSSTLPVLYVVGDQDPLTQKNGTDIFDALPKMPQSRYIRVNADHMGTVNASEKEVDSWLKAL